MTTNIQAKLRKLQTLVERGTPGEQANAQTLLTGLLEKYGLTLADIQDQRAYVAFTCRTTYDEKILLQVVGRVLNISRVRFVKTKRSRRYEIKLTPGEAAEVTRLYTRYRKQLQKEFAITFSAFVQQNEIFNATANSPDEIDDLTPAELDDLRQMFLRKETIRKVSIHRELGR